jgi:hypothetical protein
MSLLYLSSASRLVNVSNESQKITFRIATGLTSFHQSLLESNLLYCSRNCSSYFCYSFCFHFYLLALFFQELDKHNTTPRCLPFNRRSFSLYLSDSTKFSAPAKHFTTKYSLCFSSILPSRIATYVAECRE